MDMMILSLELSIGMDEVELTSFIEHALFLNVVCAVILDLAKHVMMGMENRTQVAHNVCLVHQVVRNVVVVLLHVKCAQALISFMNPDAI